jgi:hypothetical protein
MSATYPEISHLDYNNSSKRKKLHPSCLNITFISEDRLVASLRTICKSSIRGQSGSGGSDSGGVLMIPLSRHVKCRILFIPDIPPDKGKGAKNDKLPGQMVH